MSLRQRIMGVLENHRMDKLSTCSCEPGYVQSEGHIADLILREIWKVLQQ